MTIQRCICSLCSLCEGHISIVVRVRFVAKECLHSHGPYKYALLYEFDAFVQSLWYICWVFRYQVQCGYRRIGTHFRHDVGVKEKAEIHSQLWGELLNECVVGLVRGGIVVEVVKVRADAAMHAAWEFVLLCKHIYGLHAWELLENVWLMWYQGERRGGGLRKTGGEAYKRLRGGVVFAVQVPSK